MNKKIYIGSGLKNYCRVLALRDRLSEYGIELTYDWAEIIRQHKEKGVEEDQNEWQAIACAEYIGVVDAAAVVLICPAGRGGHFELGVAYARDIPIILIEDDDPIAFYYLPNIQRFKDEDDAINRLVEILK